MTDMLASEMLESLVGWRVGLIGFSKTWLGIDRSLV